LNFYIYSFFQEAIKKDPDYEEAYLKLGDCNTQLKQYVTGIEAYQQAICINPYYI